MIRTGSKDCQPSLDSGLVPRHDPPLSRVEEDPLPAPDLTVVVPTFNERDNIGPLLERLATVLAGIAWEAIFVDDDSPDGTADAVRAVARRDRRVRCLQRVGRRGLSSACIEGILASSSPIVAVMDADLQHDESLLPRMYQVLREEPYDLVVGSRYVAGGGVGDWDKSRQRASAAATWLSRLITKEDIADPMSGFFMLRRTLFEQLAPQLTGQGFKILLDLVLSAPTPLRVKEVPAEFHERVAGESKLDALVVLQFAGLLLDKTFAGYLPLRFASFAGVGAIGVMVHLAVLGTLRDLTPLNFGGEQTIATVVAMVFNFELNNVITYADQRLRGPRLWRGLLLFMAVCGVGAVANIGIAKALYYSNTTWSVAGAMGAVIGVVWNYAVSATLVWRAR
jgi:dolichol-phosphate mannosyltransferase